MINPIFDNVFSAIFPGTYDRYFDPPEPAEEEKANWREIEKLLELKLENEQVIRQKIKENGEIKTELREYGILN